VRIAHISRDTAGFHSTRQVLRLRAEAEAEMTSSPFAAQTSDDDDDQQRRGLVTSSDDDVINPRRSSSRSRRRRRFASRYRHLRKEH